MADSRTLSYTAEEIDQGVGRALPGGGIDASLQEIARNRNLLDNWDFRNPVNQRGQTSYRGTGYCIDMWKLNGTNTATIVDGGVKFGHVDNNYVADQPLEDIVDGVYTLSMLFDDNTLVYMTTPVTNGSGAISTPMYGGWSFRLSSNYARIIHIGSDTYEKIIKAVKLELGSVSTLANDPPADYGAELAKCKRYFNLWASEAARTAALLEVGAMRTTPVLSTIDIGGVTYYTASADL